MKGDYDMDLDEIANRPVRFPSIRAINAVFLTEAERDWLVQEVKDLRATRKVGAASQAALRSRIQELEKALRETTQALAYIDLWLGQPMMDGSNIPKSRELAVKVKRVGRTALEVADHEATCPTCGNRREWPVLALTDDAMTAHLAGCPDPFHTQEAPTQYSGEWDGPRLGDGT